jgi:hypothetical protein
MALSINDVLASIKGGYNYVYDVKRYIPCNGCTLVARNSIFFWVLQGTPVSSTTKTGRHDIAETLLKVALKHQRSKSNQSFIDHYGIPYW